MTKYNQLIDGKKLAENIFQDLKSKIEKTTKVNGVPPRLDIILVGDNPASLVYVKNKQQRAKKLGIESHLHHLPAESDQKSVDKVVFDLAQNKNVTGMIVQLPLPEHLNTRQTMDLIPSQKDVDGLTSINIANRLLQRPGLKPCTPLGCLTMIKSVEPNLRGKHAVVIGRSDLVGRPMADLLLAEDCTVTIAHSKTQNLESITQLADILVVAAGKENLITAKHVNNKMIVIDVGINQNNGDHDKTMIGDVDFDAVAPIVRAISPVPGGVGPMTVANLMQNLVLAAEIQSQ